MLIICFVLIDYQWNTDFPSNFLFMIFETQISLPNFFIFYRKNHLALPKDRFLKKMLYTKPITSRIFSQKLQAQIILSL